MKKTRKRKHTWRRSHQLATPQLSLSATACATQFGFQGQLSQPGLGSSSQELSLARPFTLALQLLTNMQSTYLTVTIMGRDGGGKLKRSLRKEKMRRESYIGHNVKLQDISLWIACLSCTLTGDDG